MFTSVGCLQGFTASQSQSHPARVTNATNMAAYILQFMDQ